MNGNYQDIAAAEQSWAGRLEAVLGGARPSGRPMRLGILGALGCHDVGDEAMLVAMTDRLRAMLGQVEFTIFSMRPRVTDEYLGCKSLPSLHSFFRNRKDIRSILLYLTEVAEEKLIGPLARLKSGQEGMVTSRGVIARMAYIRSYRRFLAATTGPLRGQDGRLPPAVREHIAALDRLDVLLLLGGGYLNSWHVGSQTLPFLFSTGLAKALGKTVVGSGLNLGPFSGPDRQAAGPFLGQFDLIGLRDWDESLRELEAMGIVRPDQVGYSCDDARTLEPDSMGDAALESMVRGARPYIVAQFHSWTNHVAEGQRISRLMAEALEAVLARHDVRVVMAPFQFGLEYDDSDRANLSRIRSACRCRDRITLIDRDLHPKQIKYVSAGARATVCTRHHPFVFSLSAGVPACGISYDRYYTMKLRGVSRIAPDIAHILDAKTAGADEIVSALDRCLAAGSEGGDR